MKLYELVPVKGGVDICRDGVLLYNSGRVWGKNTINELAFWDNHTHWVNIKKNGSRVLVPVKPV